jgi:hypothetical protein
MSHNAHDTAISRDENKNDEATGQPRRVRRGRKARRARSKRARVAARAEVLDALAEANLRTFYVLGG